ncbi:MAG: hypothetical protein KBT48_10435 [Firmicutes bacterium]|nr:hypothetical protein [Bacillota bacterium]
METNPILEQKCPACGAPMIYNPTLNKLECEFCGTTVDIPAQAIQEEPKPSRKEKDEALNQMEPLPVYNCVSCGAEVLVSQETGALTCPYCRNNIVLTQQFSGTIKPDGIVPFKITPDSLPQAVNDFYKDKPLLSKSFFSDSTMSKITGVYVPFWVFDCDVSGEVTFNGSKTGGSYRRGDYIYTDVKHYSLERNVSMSFADLAVDASKKMDDALMDSVAPFNLKECKPFDVRYLAGYVADRFDQTSKEVQERNDKRVTSTASSLAMSHTTSGFENVSMRQNGLKPIMKQAKYILLPIYVFKIGFEGKDYDFAVNGQTGKVVGTLPRDTRVEAKYFFKYFLIGFLFVAILIFVFFVW